MKKQFGPVWVIAEQVEGKVQEVSMQLIGQGRKLADELCVSLEVVLLGNEMDGQAQPLLAIGADRVYLGDDQDLAMYQSEIYTEIIVNLARECKPEIILIGSTSMGRELAPLVAARLKTGLTAHCIDLVLDKDKNLEGIVPAYGGLLSIICPENRPQIATVARGVFTSPIMDEDRTGEIIQLSVPNEVPHQTRTLDVIHEETEGVSLDTATVVVAGGSGAGDLGGWYQISDLAKTLNAALGSTRPAVDEGWTELDTMIGQSGKIVRPELYIGVGLSGELQHMVGIVGAKVMVAINIDAKSPIFDQVDYGVVDDCREFVPLLIDKLKEYKSDWSK